MNLICRGISLFVAVGVGLTVCPQLIKERETVSFILPSLLLLVPFFFRGCWPRSDDGWGRWVVQALAIACVFLGFLIWLPIGAWIGTPLVLPHSGEQADAIVVLASGIRPDGRPGYSGYQRVIHGVELFKAGRAPYLVLSTGDLPGRVTGREDAWVASFVSLVGLASGTYEIISDMVDTRGEARTCAGRLLPGGKKRILLVTNGGHILRGARVFEKNGFEVLPAPVQRAEEISSSQQGNLGLYHAIVHEWIGLVVYRLRGDIDRIF